MESSEKNQLVAYCGLYCGNCGKFKKGKCPGCAKNEKASWCKIRTCCMDYGYATCADCATTTPRACKNYNNLFAKFFEVVFKSDRKTSVEFIKEHGREAFADLMIDKNLMVIKKEKKQR
ncbi:MAG: DUF3795 domain-containing protein [Paludibacteraceae bacterium]